MAGHPLNDLGEIIATLEAKGRLARVKTETDARHELAGIAHRFEGGPRAVLFEKVKGRRWPVLAGLYWNRGVLAELTQCDERALQHRAADAIRTWQRAPGEAAVVTSGPVLEATEREVDLGQIPVPVHALTDGAPTLDAVVIAKNPESGVRNASVQRFEVAGCNILHAIFGPGSALEAHLEKAKRLGRSLWITINCGVGPGLFLAASAPAEAAPIERDALGIAGALQGAPVELVPGTESDVEMVAHAMWALECEIIPGENAASRPLVHARRIHRRNAPVFQTILSGAETWHSSGLFGEASILLLLQQQIPGISDVHLAPGGAGLHHAIVQIEQTRAGSSKQAILAAFAAFPPLKLVTVVDHDVDIRSADDVAWAMATRLDPADGIVVLGKSFGQKAGFDATQPFPKRAGYERAAFKSVPLEAYEIAEVGSVGTQPRARIAAAPAAPPAPAGDYDTDRIWQREVAEYRKQGEKPPEAAVVDIKPASGKDWDENRWWQREIADMKRERAAQPPAPPPKPQPAPPRATERSGPAKPERLQPRPGSSDWDENRWLERELDEMARERDKKREAPAPPKSPARPVAPSLSAPARTPEPMRAADARGNAARSTEDDEGGFFRGDPR